MLHRRLRPGSEQASYDTGGGTEQSLTALFGKITSQDVLLFQDKADAGLLDSSATALS